MSLQSSAEHPGNGSSNHKADVYRIVTDTSFLVSALFYGGNEQAVLRHIVNHHEMIVSEYIIEELIAFARNTLPKTPRRMIVAIRQLCERFIRECDEREVEVRDINDIPIMQLAITHQAIIIMGDKDMLEYRGEAQQQIISTAEYMELFGVER